MTVASSSTLPANAGGDSTAAASSSSKAGTTRRVWAACETCRKKRVRCDARQPCGGCLSIEAGKHGLTLAAYEAQLGSPIAQQIEAAAATLCYFDWNRKKRGPRRQADAAGEIAGAGTSSTGTNGASASRASVDAADEAKRPTKRKRRKDSMEHGMPRSAQSAGQAYLAAKQSGMLATPAAEQASPRPSLQVAAAQAPPLSSPVDWSAMNMRMYPPAPPTTSGGTSTQFGNAPWFATTGTNAQVTPVSEHSTAVLTPPDVHASAPGPYVNAPWQTAPQSKDFPVSAKAFSDQVALRSFAAPALPPYDIHAPGAADESWRGDNSPMSPPAPWLNGPMYGGGYPEQADASFENRAPPPPSFMQSASSDYAHSPPDIKPILQPRIQLPPIHSTPAVGGSHAPWHHPSQLSAALPVRRKTSRSHALLTKLAAFYDESDLPFIAMAIAQFGAFDAQAKLFCSKFLFGTASSGGVEGEGDISQTPNHLQLALLSVLAHRCLLMPGGQSTRDLDMAAASSVASSSASSGASPRPFGGGPGGSGQGLTGKARDSMLAFARRSYDYSLTTWKQELARGTIDPLILVTGWALDMAMSEDGAGTGKMDAFKATLFRMCVYTEHGCILGLGR